MESAEEILKQYNIAITPIRVEIINVLKKVTQPISPKEIGKATENAIDRITLYRTLKAFERENIIHKIPINDQLSTYRLINSKNKNTEKEHPHFFCKKCHKVQCLPDIPLNEYKLPGGYKKTKSNLVIEGLCNKCNIK